MSAEAILRLSVRVTDDYLSGGQVTYYAADLRDVATLAQYTASAASSAAASAAAASATYSLSLSFSLAAYGIGIGGQLFLPRVANLGTMAFLDHEQALGIFPVVLTSSYQVTPHDHGKLFIVTSGTVTITMPLGTDVPPGFFIRRKNRSGNNLTMARSGSDTFNAAATSVTIATGSAIGMTVRTSSTTYEDG